MTITPNETSIVSYTITVSIIDLGLLEQEMTKRVSCKEKTSRSSSKVVVIMLLFGCPGEVWQHLSDAFNPSE